MERPLQKKYHAGPAGPKTREADRKRVRSRRIAPKMGQPLRIVSQNVNGICSLNVAVEKSSTSSSFCARKESDLPGVDSSDLPFRKLKPCMLRKKTTGLTVLRGSTSWYIPSLEKS